MNHGSLFSGIGGFDLSAEWMGWNNIFHCEIDSFCQQVLKYYWPKATLYENIKTTDFTIHRGNIDVLTGGFPCQPYSAAGKRLGKEDDRHLWPQMLRAIQEIQPTWIVGENVRGLTNWNGGLVFDEVQADLEAEGYQVTPFLLPACAVNAPHRRDRIWFVAYSAQFGKCRQKRNGGRGEIIRTPGEIDTDGEIRTTPNPKNQRLERSNPKRRKRSTGFDSKPDWQNFPTQPPICGGNDGLSNQLDGITFPKWRNESIKAYGNAVVPQIVYTIFKSISNYEKNILCAYQNTTRPTNPQPEAIKLHQHLKAQKLQANQ